MDNISLALRIAGGVLIALLVISLFVYGFSQISQYQQQQENEKLLAQVVEFNKPFSSYENRVITGYMMVSLANKAIDYNARFVEDTVYNNDNTEYHPIHVYAKLSSFVNGVSIAASLPGTGSGSAARNMHKVDNGYYDITDYVATTYKNINADAQSEFKTYYFAWERTEYDTDANSGGTGRIIALYYYEVEKN